MSGVEATRQFWAKTCKGDERRYHPLQYHMLDVAAVAGLVWDHHLTPRLRNRLESAVGPTARNQIMFLSGAHDIGKASPGFQRKVPDLAGICMLPISPNDQDRPHGLISAHVVSEFLGHCAASTLLAQITGGHHGVFPRSADLRMGRDTLGNADWTKARQDLLNEFAGVIGFNLAQAHLPTAEITDPFVVPLLAGFIAVVDWIGSNQDFFPCAAGRGKPPNGNMAGYWRTAVRRAQTALRALGWLPAPVFANEAPFDTVFGGFRPNALQRTTSELASEQKSPYLMIVEAPMGQGKTEAALYAADLAFSRGLGRGMYIAMPTQATGNAMFKRVLNDYLKKRGHKGKLNLQLVHGNALLALAGQVRGGEIQEFKPTDIQEDDADLEAQSWFTARKRPLLAPFGVGTIDQSLLSVLQTSHWFVRLFGLAGKAVVFDEVHAYDTYMGTILERLLHWLAELDCTVILLSATLPDARRRALAFAYSGSNEAECRRYPRITLAKPRHYLEPRAPGVVVCQEIPAEQASSLSIGFAGTDPKVVTDLLAETLANGGCAAVVCNTVDRAIEVYAHLSNNLKGTECLLFHARTLQMWRREREEEVLRKFGKGEKQDDGTYHNPHRPERAVLVATQVVEQSLDLDFDFMISEIAPVDLLVQRSGRLHRHTRARPRGLEMPKLVLLCNAERSGPPPDTFGTDIQHVYDRYILLRTWLALRGRNSIQIPMDVETLIEAVYGPDSPASPRDWSLALEEAHDRMQAECTESERAASRLLVLQPGDPGDLVEDFNDRLLDEEDPEVHKTVRAATREGEPSITAVFVKPDAVLSPEPGVTEVRSLLDRSVKLSHRGVFRAMLANGVTPNEWANNAHLRYARLLRLNDRNEVHVGQFTLAIDEKLGITIGKDGDDNG